VTGAKDSVTLQLEVPKRVYDFIKNHAKEFNKTVEEYIDLVIQKDIAEVLAIKTRGHKEGPEELASDLGLDTYIMEGKKWVIAFDLAHGPKTRQSAES
jgi:hypothetical protein